MAIAGSVSTTKIEALAHELRFLKCGMADLQGRLDTLLGEIDGEVLQAQAGSEAAAGVVADLPAVAEAEVVAEVAREPAVAEVPAATEAEIAVEVMEVVEASEASEIEAIVVTEPTVDLIEAAQSETIVPVETVAETPAIVDAIPTVASTEPVAHVAVWAEPVVPAAEQVDTPAAELPGQNVIIFAEHRREAGKRRGAIARTARWAAAIALIATVAAVAAAGTGFAGNGELLVKSVCAIAGEGCSLTLGMP